jgi:hypothetical protein
MKRIAASKMIWFPLALTTACAAGLTSSRPDPVAGHWSGTIDRDGWERQVVLNIAIDHGSYAGSWMSMESQPGMTIDRLTVEGDDVRFQLKSLAFAGRVDGGTLAGSVTDSVSGAPSGQFTLMRIDPRQDVLSNGP